MTDPLRGFGSRVPKSQLEPQRAEQVQNSAGGYVFAVDPMKMAHRFLILGTTGGTYYASERELTEEDALLIEGLSQDYETGVALLRLIESVSLKGRASKQEPTLFALAACAGSPDLEVRRLALEMMPRICRTSTMFFQFNSYVEQFRGHGRTLNRALGAWYTEKSPKELAYQAIKYRQRHGWTHRDVLRKARPKVTDPEIRAVIDWITHGTPQERVPPYEQKNAAPLPTLLEAYLRAKTATRPATWVKLIDETYLPWEALPNAALAHKEVWEALVPKMGLTALMRNLGRLSKLGVIEVAPNAITADIVYRLTEPDGLWMARINPLTILTALVTYKRGGGIRGTMRWDPSGVVIDALNEAFYRAFDFVTPTGKRTLVALDVSASIDWGYIAKSPLSARQAATALTMVTLRQEPAAAAVAFSDELTPLSLSPRQRLDDAIAATNALPFARTDCSLPMRHALKQRMEIDVFQVLTDNETWYGDVHPFTALMQYRQKMGIPAKLVVVGMTATRFSIADPRDTGMMDVVGMDSSTPEVIRAFSADEF